MSVVRLAASLSTMLVVFASIIEGSAAIGIATPIPSTPLDLAALTLRPSDLDDPAWVHDGAFMQALADLARGHAAYLGPETTADEVMTVLTTAGWEAQYVSSLSLASKSDPAEPAARVRSYVTRYAAPEGAAAGFAFLDDEHAVPAAADIPTAGPHGDASELTRDDGDGTPTHSLDLTFRMGNLVAGVTLIEDGSADQKASDQELVERLATRMEERITASASRAIGIGAHTVRLVSERHDIVTFDDAYYRLDAEDVPLGGESSQAASLRTRTYAEAREVYQLWQGIDTGTDDGALFGVTLLRFQDEAAADGWIMDLESTLAETPFYGDLRFVAGAADVGVGDRAVALSFIANGGGGDAPRSMLVAVRFGADVARVHLVPQGTVRSIPLEPVVELARGQAACLGERACPVIVEVPTALSTLLGDERQPVASPEASPDAILVTCRVCDSRRSPPLPCDRFSDTPLVVTASIPALERTSSTIGRGMSRPPGGDERGVIPRDPG